MIRRYKWEGIILLLQAVVFYGIPLCLLDRDSIGTVLAMVVSTLLLAICLGLLSHSRLRWAYPLLCAVLYLPSVVLFYHQESSVYVIWYFLMSGLGLLMGSMVASFLEKK